MNFKTNQIKPAIGHFLVKPAEVESKTASGILLPDSGHEKTQYGEVLAVGGDIFLDGELIKAEAAIGDTVIYRQWSGVEIKLMDDEVELVKFTDLLAVIEQGKK